MIGSVLFCLYLGFFLYYYGVICFRSLFRSQKVRESCEKRKYIDCFDIIDEPVSKKLRFDEFITMRVNLNNADNLYEDREEELYFSDDDSLSDYLSDSTVDEAEYFGRYSPINRYQDDVLMSDANWYIGCPTVDRPSDVISISSESSLSIVSISSSSTVEFVYDGDAYGNLNNIVCFFGVRVCVCALLYVCDMCAMYVCFFLLILFCLCFC